jgi:hypothetical protein
LAATASLITIATLAVLLGPTPSAQAGDVARCTEPRTAPARGLCADFEAAPRLPATELIGQQALRVWARVADPV